MQRRIRIVVVVPAGSSSAGGRGSVCSFFDALFIFSASLFRVMWCPLLQLTMQFMLINKLLLWSVPMIQFQVYFRECINETPTATTSSAICASFLVSYDNLSNNMKNKCYELARTLLSLLFFLPEIGETWAKVKNQWELCWRGVGSPCLQATIAR